MMFCFFLLSSQTAALEQKEKDHFDASKYSWKVALPEASSGTNVQTDTHLQPSKHHLIHVEQFWQS